MSLINQVLKDLEQRHAEQLVEATHSLDGLAFTPQAANRPARRRWIVPGLLILIAVGAALAYWFWSQHVNTRSFADITSQPVVQPAPETMQAQSSGIDENKSTAVAAPVSAQHTETRVAAVKPVETAQVRAVQAAAKPAAIPEENNTPLAKQMVPLRPEQKAELSYQSGYQYLQQHQHRRAEQDLREALRIEAGHNKARELLTGLLIKQGRWIEASEILQRGIQISPHHRAFVTLQARTLMQLERDRQAIALLRDYAPPMHDDPEHYALLAALYQRQADHVSAVNTYMQLLKLRPNAGIWWVGLGISLEALDKQAEARHAYQQAQQSGTLHADISRYTDNRLLALQAIRYPVD